MFLLTWNCLGPILSWNDYWCKISVGAGRAASMCQGWMASFPKGLLEINWISTGVTLHALVAGRCVKIHVLSDWGEQGYRLIFAGDSLSDKIGTRGARQSVFHRFCSWCSYHSKRVPSSPPWQAPCSTGRGYITQWEPTQKLNSGWSQMSSGRLEN